MEKKMLFAILLCFSLLLSGCKNDNSEQITDYAGSSLHTDNRIPQENEHIVGVDDLPSAQIDGEPLWDSILEINGVKVSFDLRTIFYNIDRLHVYPVKKISKNSINEEKTVSAVFGDRFEEVRMFYENTNYSSDIVQRCNELNGIYFGERASLNASVKSWYDGEGFFWHIYSGYYLNVQYNMLIAYSDKEEIKEVMLFPVNPGDVVGDGYYNAWYGFDVLSEQINGVLIGDMKERGETLKNQSTKSDSSNRKMIRSFCENQLLCYFSEDDMYSGNQLEGGEHSIVEVLFYHEDDYGFPDKDKASINGYLYELSWIRNRNSGFPDNLGLFLVNDEAVFAVDLKISYEMAGSVNEDINILDLNGVRKSVEQILSENMNQITCTGDGMDISQMQLVYHFSPSINNKGEGSIIPTWKIPLYNNTFCIATLYVNAIDGSLIEIDYDYSA